MNFRLLCILMLVSAGPFGLAFLLVPELVSSLYGVTGFNPGTIILGRKYGVGLLFASAGAYAVMNSADLALQRRFAQAFGAVSAIGAIVSLHAVLTSSANSLMWSIVVLFGAFFFGWSMVAIRVTRSANA